MPSPVILLIGVASFIVLPPTVHGLQCMKCLTVAECQNPKPAPCDPEDTECYSVRCDGKLMNAACGINACTAFNWYCPVRSVTPDCKACKSGDFCNGPGGGGGGGSTPGGGGGTTPGGGGASTPSGGAGAGGGSNGFHGGVGNGMLMVNLLVAATLFRLFMGIEKL